jgi:hypothetical protein
MLRTLTVTGSWVKFPVMPSRHNMRKNEYRISLHDIVPD